MASRDPSSRSRGRSHRRLPPQEDEAEEEEEEEEDDDDDDEEDTEYEEYEPYSDGEQSVEVILNGETHIVDLVPISAGEQNRDRREVSSPTVSLSSPSSASSEEEEGEEERGNDSVETSVAEKSVDLGENSVANCPVCLEMWTSEGPHRICCIPCGHVYGRLCLEKWVRRCGNKIAKCPQCNRKFKPKEIINLYAPLIAVTNEKSEVELQILREKYESLIREKACLLEELRKRQKQLHDEERLKRQKMTYAEQSTNGSRQKNLFEYSENRLNSSARTFSGNTAVSNSRFILQNELVLDGARVMGIDSSSQILIVSSKAPGLTGEYILNKISLLDSREIEKIQLPQNTKAIKDLCILPDKLVAIASLGKKLALFSMTSNNFVLEYNLPAPAWSCSGDGTSPYYIYTGLQNGKLLVFDIRQTGAAMQCMEGISMHPVHTVHTLNVNGKRKVLTASSIGPCLWDLDDNSGDRPSLVPGLETLGVCISLACNTQTDNSIVATFRPRVDLGQTEQLSSQISVSPSPSTVSNSGKLGSHVLIRSTNDGTSFCKDQICHGHVSGARMSRSAIVTCDVKNPPMFAYGDEMARGVRVWNLPSFERYADLNLHRDPILDLRYVQGNSGPGFLGCLSEEKLQVFSCH